jgi:hypothetical protein
MNRTDGELETLKGNNGTDHGLPKGKNRRWCTSAWEISLRPKRPVERDRSWRIQRLKWPPTPATRTNFRCRSCGKMPLRCEGNLYPPRGLGKPLRVRSYAWNELYVF